MPGFCVPRTLKQQVPPALTVQPVRRGAWENLSLYNKPQRHPQPRWPSCKTGWLVNVGAPCPIPLGEWGGLPLWVFTMG